MSCYYGNNKILERVHWDKPALLSDLLFYKTNHHLTTNQNPEYTQHNSGVICYSALNPMMLMITRLHEPCFRWCCEGFVFYLISLLCDKTHTPSTLPGELAVVVAVAMAVAVVVAAMVVLVLELPLSF